MNTASEEELVERAVDRSRTAISELVSLFEDRRPAAQQKRARVLEALDSHPKRRSALVIGLTGTPGCGKSTLMSVLVPAMLAARDEVTIGILAVDPSSPISGGALLGDRTRMRMEAEEPRLFFRSQASDRQLGGLSPTTFRVCRLMSRLFDCVFVETVGIGQSEADIRSVADRTYLVLQPFAGDEIQFLKAGIMEIPDAFILNKCDIPLADRSYHQLRATIDLARPSGDEEIPIWKTSAKDGLGIKELADAMLMRSVNERLRDAARRETLFFGRWVREEWGRNGSQFLELKLRGAAEFVRACGGVERAQEQFESNFRTELAAH